MEGFDRRYQTRHNGPLTPEVRGRLTKFREDGATLKDIGDALEISGAFVSKLLNPKAPANISTIHIPRIIRALEKHEQEAGYSPKKDAGEASSPGPELEVRPLSMSDAKKGLALTFGVAPEAIEITIRG